MINILWVALIIALIILSFIISKHINFNNFKLLKMLKLFNKKDKKGLFLTLGTKIGVGSIIGTTISIYVGGPGSLLWMILFSFFTTSLIYYESYVGTKYKEKVSDTFLSGPYYYIKNGINDKLLALVSMILLIICYSFFFQMIQTNTITNILSINFKINPLVIAFVFLIFVLIIIFFSLKKLVISMNKIVPIMCLIYISLGVFCIVKNANDLGNIVGLIISSAFTKRGIIIGLIIGVKRAIFLNEIMIGTSSIGTSIDDNSSEENGYIQTLGIYFITFIISLITGFLVLLFKNNNVFFISNYSELISQVFIYHFKSFGPYILTIILSLFAITTIISGYYIGESNLKGITNNKKIILVFKIFVLLFCISGVFINSDIIWKFIDIIMYALILINIYSLYKIYRGEKCDRKRLG